jgi:K+-transporting ATPase ATPase A chain
MLDSNTPLGGMVPMVLMQLGEVAPGGVGTGLYGMLLVALMAVFVGGLMIGRTPEYVGKKIESFEMKMVSLGLLVSPLLVLLGTAIASVSSAGLAGLGNSGAHGFSEILYAFTSASNNNGSAFGGLNANTPFYNLLLAIAMWFGRFVTIIAALAIAGSMAVKKRLAESSGTMPTHGALFVGLLIGTVVLVAALTFLPALALGPIAEHLTLWGAH